LDINLSRLDYLDEYFHGHIVTLFCSSSEIKRQIQDADLIIGAVLITGAKAPKMLASEDLKILSQGTVLVDIAIDQGGCFETSIPTYHDAPIFIIDGIVHYCVANIPGSVPYTSTIALTNATLSYGLAIADKGLELAAVEIPGIMDAINTYKGSCTQKKVADSFGLSYEKLKF